MHVTEIELDLWSISPVQLRNVSNPKHGYLRDQARLKIFKIARPWYMLMIYVHDIQLDSSHIILPPVQTAYWHILLKTCHNTAQHGNSLWLQKSWNDLLTVLFCFKTHGGLEGLSDAPYSLHKITPVVQEKIFITNNSTKLSMLPWFHFLIMHLSYLLSASPSALHCPQARSWQCKLQFPHCFLEFLSHLQLGFPVHCLLLKERENFKQRWSNE